MTNHAIDGMGNSFGVARALASEGSTASVFKRVRSRPGFWLTARSLAVATLLSFAAAGFVNAQDRRAGVGWTSRSAMALQAFLAIPVRSVSDSTVGPCPWLA